MRFLWPTKLNPNPGVITRLGRVLHWVGTLLATPLLLGAIFNAYRSTQARPSAEVTNFYETSAETYFGMALGLLTMTLLFYFGGRALRYILSGE